jgi:group II intron reverse transcriptase/maturase
MQNAEDVLNVYRDRGSRGLPLEDVYRQLYKPSLYLRAYGRIYRNDGAMTRGATQETVDGMSLEKIDKIIEALRFERYRWTPVRRVEIPKAKQPGKTRPLGIPTWSDKLLQEVLRSILEAYYEPQFSDHSHGFRPERGCHTALVTVAQAWRGVRWFIEGDIKGCFDNIDHQILLSILREKIHDNRFLRLIELLLDAGYLEKWDYRPTLSGTPQGGIISPILSNLYLDRLDRYVKQTLIPEHTRGTTRAKNSEYKRLQQRAWKLKKHGEPEKARDLKKQYQKIPSVDPEDPHFRRLYYIRYADDFLLGFVGPKAEAEEIKEKLARFLCDQLKLELSATKTLITHAATDAARFLGYEIATRYCDTKHDHRGHRSINGQTELRIPAKVVEERCAVYMQGGKPIHRTELLNDDDYTIVTTYQSEYRGFVQYYQLAEDIAYLGRLQWTMQSSLLKTLAHKHNTSVSKISKKHRATVQTANGPRKCLKVIHQRDKGKPLVAYFGGIPLTPTCTQDGWTGNLMRNRILESRVMRKYHARFGGGPTEKERQRHLAGGLPYHYERRDSYPSIPYFQEKGFRVWPAGWRDLEASRAFIADAQRHAGERMLGYLFTVWSDADRFLNALLGEKPPAEGPGQSEESAATLRACIESVGGRLPDAAR